MPNIFLDTNIVLDILIASRPSHKQSVLCLEKIITEDYHIMISEDMISTIYYVSKNKIQTLAFLQTIMEEWQVVAYGEGVIKKAIEFSLKNNTDLEDILQCFCAKENHCILFLTNDKTFMDCGIDIVNVDTFLTRR